MNAERIKELQIFLFAAPDDATVKFSAHEARELLDIAWRCVTELQARAAIVERQREALERIAWAPPAQTAEVLGLIARAALDGGAAE